MEESIIIAASSADSPISSWSLHSGTDLLRYKSSASPSHGLASISSRLLVSSQLRDSKSSSPLIYYWSYDKPQLGLKSFPEEPIGPLISNSDGTYLIGGGSGSIYLWEVSSGRLLNKWHAHYRSVTCFAFSGDGSFLISGSEDGSVKVWSLARIFDPRGREAAKDLFTYNFYGHNLRVTDVVSGHFLSDSIVISSSEDRTCKIWSLSEGSLLRSITFPSIVDAIAIDTGKPSFYAGGRDGRIYIAAVNAECNPNSSYGMSIIGSLFDHSKAITCLKLGTDGVTLVCGSEDGRVRVWDTKSQNVIRVLKHGKGPVTNVLIATPQVLENSQDSLSRKRVHLPLPPPLEKYITSIDGDADSKSVTVLQPSWHDIQDSRYRSSHVMKKQIIELQQCGSSGAAEMELERLRQECKRSTQMAQQWKKLYQDLQNVCVDELLSEAQLRDS